MLLEAYFRKDWHEFREACGYYILPVLLSVCGLFLLRRLLRTNLNLPPGPTGLPLVGYLPFFRKEPFKVLDKLSKKYGNIFSLYLGQTYVVILGDDQAVKEAFSKATTIDRPPHLFEVMPDGFGITGANGEDWVQQRRFIVKTMKDLGLGRSTWGRLVEEEVTEFLQLLESKEGCPVEIEGLLTPTLTNNISSFVFGEKLPPGSDKDLLNYYMKTIANFFTTANVSSFYPWLHKLLVKLKLSSFCRIQCELSSLNAIIRKRINLHLKSQGDSRGANFIDEYINILKDKEETGTFFTEQNMIANTTSLYFGGSDTTITSLSWLFLIMAGRPDVQEKVHSEVVSISGTQSRPSWGDRLKYPYSYAVILETLRWKPIVPLNLQRMASEDTEVCGYVIPKGATIIANFWSLLNDPRCWPEPEKFKPERFLQNGGKDVNVKQDSFFPFSYGKRKCPGETVAMMEIFLYLTCIVQVFKIRTPNGRKVNFDGILGITYQPVPQELCFIPRQEIRGKI